MLIEHADCLAEDLSILEDQVIAVRDGWILDILPQREAGRFRSRERIDGRNKLWMPGLIDAHMHTGQQLLKGRILDERPMIWTRIMLPFESTLTPDKMVLSAELAALEMIQNGTTGFIESGSYFMEATARVYAASGLRGALSCSTMDQGSLPDSIRQTADEAIACTDALYEQFHQSGNLKVFYSLRALMNCSDEPIVKAADHARTRHTMLQAHMNEYAGEVNYTLEKYSMRPMAYLDNLKVLDENFIAVHCPFSNCGKGVPDTPALMEQNITIGLGTDGAAHGGLSLWNEMKIFRSVMNAVWGCKTANPAIMPAAAILKMATANGASILDESGHLGCLKAGYRADMIAVDWSNPRLFATGNRINTLLECTDGRDVTDSMVAGRFLMKNRECLTLDEERILWKTKQYFNH